MFSLRHVSFAPKEMWQIGAKSKPHEINNKNKHLFFKNKMVQKFAPYCWQTLLFKFYFGYVLSFSLLSVFKEKESTKEKEINATN